MEVKEETSGWKVWGIACLLATLVVLSPIGMLVWVMQKGAQDMQHARDEFKRTVNPDELRAWVFSQAKKRPLEWHSEEGKAEWPDTFPHFAESHRFRVSLSIPRTSLIWDFSGGYSLRVNVFLNPDGTPVDVDEYLLLANGITIDFLAR